MAPSSSELDAPAVANEEINTQGQPGNGRTPGAKGQHLSEVQGALWIAGLGLVWAVMVFWVQSLTTTPMLWKTPLVIYKNWTFRFLFDWSLATLLLARFSPKVILGLLAANLWLSTAILSFYINYQRALSWLTIKSQAGEGAAVFMVALQDASPYLAVLIPLSGLLAFVFQRIRSRLGRQIRLQKLAAAVWTVVFLGVHFDHKPLDALELFESTDGIAHCYGFITTWFAEAHYIQLEGITEDALSQLKEPANRLIEKVPPMELGERLAVIQIESLDDAVRNFTIKGREVTPAINRFAREGNVLRVQAPKKNGSCDSDFTLLMGALPSARMSPYRIPDFPFERSLVGPLTERGIHTSLYHGVNGTFFERRPAFERMGFHNIVFREEIIKKLDLKDPEWTVTDGEMFRLMGSEREHKDRFFEFSITGTSHTPFYFSLEDFPRTFFPGKDNRDYDYFDTIAYVDKVLGEYVEGLPTGTVVLLYGDHWSRVDNRELGYHSQMINDFGIVPAVLFKKTEQGLQPLFDLDEEIALSATMRLVDVTAWLRKSLRIPPASGNTSTPAP
jgi:hypothetical protein